MLPILSAITLQIDTLFNQGSIDDCFDTIQSILDSNPRNRALLEKRLKLHELAYDNEITSSHYEEYLVLFPNCLKAKYICMMYYLRHHRYHKAESIYLNVRETQKDSNKFYMRSEIMWHYYVGNENDLKQYVLRYAKLFKNDDFAANRLIDIYAAEKTSESVVELDKMRSKYEQLPGFHPILRKIYKKMVLVKRGLAKAKTLKTNESTPDNKIVFLEWFTLCYPLSAQTNDIISDILSHNLSVRQLKILLHVIPYHSSIAQKRLLAYVKDNPYYLNYQQIGSRVDILTQEISIPKDQTSKEVSIQKLPKVDIVFTWVDLDDDTFHDAFVKEIGYSPRNNQDPNGGQNRYTSHGEIQLALLSLFKYMPWLNHVYIVTHGQSFSLSFLKPKFEAKITFIDQTELIPKDYVDGDVFHSNLVETFIYRIPNLVEHFLYFCDDMILGNNIKYSDLFSEQKVPFSYLMPIGKSAFDKDVAVYNYSKQSIVSWKFSRYNVHKLFHRDFQRDLYFDSIHQGMFMVKSVCKEIYERYKEEWKDGFFTEMVRGERAVYTPLLANLVAISKGKQCIPEPNLPLNQSKIFNIGLSNENLNYIIDEKPLFYCLNYIVDKKSELNLQKLIFYVDGNS